MTQMSKRSIIKWGGFVALAATAALVGCGKKEEPAKPAATAAAPCRSACPQGRAVQGGVGLCRPGGRRRLDLRA